MKLFKLPVHIMTTKTLDKKIQDANKAAVALSRRISNRQMSHLLLENVKMKAIIDNHRMMKGL